MSRGGTVNMRFNYYYGAQADQFSFVRIPRIMLTGKEFQVLSMASKMLYGVLLDRMNLSMKNGWLDEENRVYIIYQISEIQDDLGFSKKKAMELLSELEDFGLLQKKRRGRGLPNILYVKSFMEDASVRSTETGSPNAKEKEDRGSEAGTSEKETPGSSDSRSAENWTLEVPGTAPLEVPESGALKNQTNINNTYRSNTESNPIVSTGEEKPIREDMIRSEEKRYTDTPAARAKIYEQIIRENICYDDLLFSHAEDWELIDGIKDLILETVVGTRDEILIASSRYPAEVVRSKFLKLNYFHIEYVLHCLRQNTTKVKNIRKYLLATLFNAPSTMDGYYQAEVNHDMPQYAAAR